MTRSCETQAISELIDRGTETDKVVMHEFLGDIGYNERIARDRKLGREGYVTVSAAGLVDLIADDLAVASYQQNQVDNLTEARSSLSQDVDAEHVALRGRVGDIFGRILRCDKLGLVVHHHGMLADGVDHFRREYLAATPRQKPPLVESHAN